MELSILCGCEIALIVFNSSKLFHYSSSDLDSTLVKYADFNEESNQAVTNKDVCTEPLYTVYLQYDVLFGSGKDSNATSTTTPKKRTFNEVENDDKEQLLTNLQSKRERSRAYAPPVAPLETPYFSGAPPSPLLHHHQMNHCMSSVKCRPI
jgi:hypothetical protein